jgi:hypothetical protein
VDADADPAFEPVGPFQLAKHTLDRNSCLDRRRWVFEYREELICTRIDLVPARSPHLAANDGLDVISHSRVTIAQVFE